MDTGTWRLTAGQLTEWLAGLRAAGKRVIGPVEEGGLRRFRAVDSPEELNLGPGKTRWSPKEHLFPRTETLFSYAVDGGTVQLEDAVIDDAEQVLVGVRPCDAAGLARLDAVFLGDPPDGLYGARRTRTTIVSLACDSADPECFCTAVGGDPAGQAGSDLQLLTSGDGFILRTLTTAGTTLVAALPGRAAAPTEVEREEAEARIRQVVEQIRQSPVARDWAAALEGNFGSPLWEALGRRCLGCSICTYVCPSCSCFDVHDAGGEQCGDRCRSWDSCTFAQFTRHASGHNPRGTPAARYRQRVLHKFAYYPLAREGQLMCVGCGRCVRLCPVGMDVLESARRVATAVPEGHDVHG